MSEKDEDVECAKYDEAIQEVVAAALAMPPISVYFPSKLVTQIGDGDNEKGLRRLKKFELSINQSKEHYWKFSYEVISEEHIDVNQSKARKLLAKIRSKIAKRFEKKIAKRFEKL